VSDWDPMEEYRTRCNRMCNDLWKHMDRLQEQIDKLPDSDAKNYQMNQKSIVSLLAELYFFQAVSLGQINGMDKGVIRALFKEVFGNRQIQLPYEPEKDETLHEAVNRYKKKEPTIDWIDRDLKDKAKDIEQKKGGSDE
jgi:hypothetical protein